MQDLYGNSIGDVSLWDRLTLAEKESIKKKGIEKRRQAQASEMKKINEIHSGRQSTNDIW